MPGGNVLARHEFGPKSVHAVHFSGDAEHVVVIPTFDDPVRVCSAATGDVVAELPVSALHCDVGPGARFALLSPRRLEQISEERDIRGQRIVHSKLDKGPVELWDVRAQRVVQRFPSGPDAEARLSPDGKTIILNQKDGVTEVWRETATARE
jgi:hypothetical protein